METLPSSSFPHPKWRYRILTLPKELVREIFSYLDRDELRCMALAFPDLADVANDRPLLRRLCLYPDDFDRKTLHQVIAGYVNVSQLTIVGGLRFTKSSCQRISKDLGKLSHLCLYLHSPAKTIDQELLNVTTHLPQLSSLELSFSEPSFTKDGLLTAIMKIKRLERLHLTQSVNHSEIRQTMDNPYSQRIDLNLLLNRLASLRNAFLKDVRITFQSHRDVRRCTHEGLKSLSYHWRTLTSLYLKHLEFNPKRSRIGRQSEVISFLGQLRNLKELGLTCVEGFNTESWIDLFVEKSGRGSLDTNRNLSSLDGTTSTLAVFPKLEVLELDFLPDIFLRPLGRVYGESLKRLGLFEYTCMFDAGNDENANCPKEFSQILSSFKALSHVSIGIKSNSFDARVRRVLRWFINDELDTLPFSIEIAKL